MTEELWVIAPPLATGIHYALGPNAYGVFTLMRDACCYYAPTYYRAANAHLYSGVTGTGLQMRFFILVPFPVTS